MLVPIQTSGNKAPLFFVHGLHGVMPLGPTFAEVLGPDQPIYAIHANGVDGRKPVTDTMPDMVLDYVADIEEARPTGPLVVGGMCEGSHAAIEIARAISIAAWLPSHIPPTTSGPVGRASSISAT